MTFIVSGLDMMPYIARGGLKFQRADVDGANAGRAQNGDMIRDRVAIKGRWDVTCRPVDEDELADILEAIEPEYVECTITDKRTKQDATGYWYSNNVPMSLEIVYEDGRELWSGLTFPIIQK